MLPPVSSFLTLVPPNMSSVPITYPLSLRDQDDPDVVWLHPCPSKCYPIHCPTSYKIIPLVKHMRHRFPPYPIEKPSPQMNYQSQQPQFPPNTSYCNGEYIPLSSTRGCAQSNGYQICGTGPDPSLQFQSPPSGTFLHPNSTGNPPIYQSQMSTSVSYDVSNQCLQPTNAPMQHASLTSTAPPYSSSTGAASQHYLQSTDTPYPQSTGNFYRLMIPYPRYSPRPSCALQAVAHNDMKPANNGQFEGYHTDRPIPGIYNYNQAEFSQWQCYTECIGAYGPDNNITYDSKKSIHKFHKYPERQYRQSKGYRRTTEYAEVNSRHENMHMLPIVKQQPLESYMESGVFEKYESNEPLQIKQEVQGWMDDEPTPSATINENGQMFYYSN